MYAYEDCKEDKHEAKTCLKPNLLPRLGSIGLNNNPA